MDRPSMLKSLDEKLRHSFPVYMDRKRECERPIPTLKISRLAAHLTKNSFLQQYHIIHPHHSGDTSKYLFFFSEWIFTSYSLRGISPLEQPGRGRRCLSKPACHRIFPQ
ncbi:uncharacterized protein BO95DRAFT_229236 [Aspergillus brunneoviolaceus CBS 621.78]|uniref:Uncharacterized protein n=1 Tax=Aspergillus brunneoviolaceus CBS 621.78 TaxID=1450534 RepID=A0ACD1G0A3_9EURO|nr:hypothetical protein BO95DRAFT_229236 [Aspergillus brunneoviolaceus CBS 621.78]RAH42660.1 hypothetical protein BO95DRAFT_229236 [Aspergillus brunneoviolaceus CBS 621.78]